LAARRPHGKVTTLSASSGFSFMAKEPATQIFMASAKAAAATMIGGFVGAIGWALFVTRSDFWAPASLFTIGFYGGLLVFALVVGFGVAWLSVLRNRKNVRNRAKPLSFDE
jgi:hypothetical protein